VLVVDRDGTVVSVNSSAQAMLGEGLSHGDGASIAFDRRPMIAEDGRPSRRRTTRWPWVCGPVGPRAGW